MLLFILDNAGHDVSEFLRNIIERIHKGRDQNIIYEVNL